MEEKKKKIKILPDENYSSSMSSVIDRCILENGGKLVDPKLRRYDDCKDTTSLTDILVENKYNMQKFLLKVTICNTVCIGW